MNTYTKVDYIEMIVPNGAAGSIGVNIAFPSQSNLENKLIRKIAVVTRINGTPYSPGGIKLISDGNAESMWLTLNTTYDVRSGSNNQGNNINKLQLCMLAQVRGNYSTTGTSNFFAMVDQDVPEWTGIFVNWTKSTIQVNFSNDGTGQTAAGKAIVLAVYYDDMFTSNGVPVGNSLAAIQESNAQMEKEILYLKGMLPPDQAQAIGTTGGYL